MVTVVLDLSDQTEQKLREQASQTGQTLEAYLVQLAQQAAEGQNGPTSTPAPFGSLSDEDFERLLDKLSDGLALLHLPAGFSRSDIYADHD